MIKIDKPSVYKFIMDAVSKTSKKYLPLLGQSLQDKKHIEACYKDIMVFAEKKVKNNIKELPEICEEAQYDKLLKSVYNKVTNGFSSVVYDIINKNFSDNSDIDTLEIEYTCNVLPLSSLDIKNDYVTSHWDDEIIKYVKEHPNYKYARFNNNISLDIQEIINDTIMEIRHSIGNPDVHTCGTRGLGSASLHLYWSKDIMVCTRGVTRTTYSTIIIAPISWFNANFRK